MAPLSCAGPSPASAARLFVQLSMRRSPASTSPMLSDVLLPSRTTAARVSSYEYATSAVLAAAAAPVPVPMCSAALSQRQSGSVESSARRSIYRPQRHHRGRQQQQQQRRQITTATTAATITITTSRAFSTTRPRRATHAAFNPQKDEDGNEMLLEITPRAAHRLSEIMAKDSNPHLALRIQVESGGCHGFQYLMSLVTLPQSLPSPEELARLAEEQQREDEAEEGGSDSTGAAGSYSSSSSPSPAAGAETSSKPAIRGDDTIFTFATEASEPPAAAAAATAQTDLASTPKIILDQPSLELLKGSKVDFTMELIGSQFKIVDNPLATSSCGCGTSFDIKI